MGSPRRNLAIFWIVFAVLVVAGIVVFVIVLFAALTISFFHGP